jgi:hypothetical protein
LQGVPRIARAGSWSHDFDSGGAVCAGVGRGGAA